MQRTSPAVLKMSVLFATVTSLAPFASQAAPVTPAEWFNSQPAPVFKPGNTLPRLTRYAYQLAPVTQKALAERWNYCVQLNYTSNASVDLLISDPTSFQAQIVALTKSDPVKYPLAVTCDRSDPASVDNNTYLRDANGALIAGNTYSPLNPQWVIDEMAALRADPLRRLRAQVPINIILNGGEYGLGVLSENRNKWYADPKVNSAVAAAGGDLFDFQSKAKANESNTIFNAVASAVPDRSAYIYYNSGNQDRNRYYTWKDYSFDGQYTRHEGDYQAEEYYYKDQNDGWLPGAYDNDELTRALNAKGFALSGGTGQPYEKFSYDWLCSGYREYDPSQISPMNTYTGFLKCLFTTGMLGGNAGYYGDGHDNAFFDASFDSAAPPNWAQQMARLTHVQALFSYLESDVRNSDLLPGPNMHVKSTTQPAYEFPTGSPGTRVVARKVTGQNKWIITAWAADGVDRTVQVTIPILGNVALSARAAGSVYIATITNGQMQLMLTDSNAMTPTVGGYAPVDVTPTRISNPNPVFVNGGFETPVLSGGGTAYIARPSGAGWSFALSGGIQRNGSYWQAANAPEGSQTAFLQLGGTMSQVVSLDGGTYKLRFQAARRSGQLQPIQIKIDGVNVGSTITPTSDTFAVYDSAEFTVFAGNHEITMATTDTSGDKSSFVDDVKIVVSAPDVPTAANGVFETPVLSGGGTAYAYNPTGAGWTFAANSGIQRNGSYWDAANAPEGSQTAFLQSDGAMSQSMSFDAGTYKLRFQAAQRPSYSGGQPIQIKIDGVNLGSTIMPSSSNFALYDSAAFTVTAGNHTITLAGTDATIYKTSFVDDVRVVVSTPAVLGVVSGGFETPVLSGGGTAYVYNPTGAGWNFASNSGVQRNGSYWTAANAPEGSQTAFVQGNSTGLGEVSQLLNLLAGTYTVQFQAAQRATYSGGQPIQIKIDGVNVGAPILPANSAFATYNSAAFTAPGGNISLSLSATDGAGEKSSFLDDVQIVTASAAAMQVTGSGVLADGAGVYDYGTVNVATPLDHTFTINNTGARTLTFTGSPYAVVSGTNAADFSVTTQPAATVAGGASTTFIVRFTPGAGGARTATISIASNDAITSPYTFNVTGSGLAIPAAPSTLAATRPANRQINLTWKDNSGNESGFKIERATNSTFTTNLVQVATTAANIVTYSNTGLAANTRYYYRIRATNAAGNSAYSNVVNALTGA